MFLVLSPCLPWFNGNVERSNWTTKYEFFYQYHGPSKRSVFREKMPMVHYGKKIRVICMRVDSISPTPDRLVRRIFKQQEMVAH